MATLTVFPNTGDGSIGRDGLDAVFADAHDALTGTLSTASTSGYALCRNNAGTFDIYRGLQNYDTSPIGAGGTVSAVTGNLWSILHDGTVTDAGWNFYGSTGSEPIVGDDYDLVGTTAFSTTKFQADVIDGAYNTWTGNATFIAAINVTGITKVSLREAIYDVANTAPSAGNVGYINYNSSSTEGTSKDPYLEITYTAGAVGGTAASTTARRTPSGGIAVGGGLNF